ncbi:hypothetical protein [Sulfitobacter mediterraneus]|uniref:hypothetical protein n=2 Tax=Sulfitobacter mediterraneus TaxID=83219 RepID=UPI0019399C9A|nr:hypothetical protein [Sulfitobacter mediterraneus]MBM1631561.1 hypothetical protein [Sulfitobacter mediterraneus]MBM1647471.1 hypothetical protein [Sulfitobacter mediterraneus]MBM1659610.1 hypothetical protein [Sulfitobacter mediterraneus]MBM1667704.1 hypothetical protein [Sulfitobacter mediterraneus]MBM1675796.1 hypothetical protein [Sulfitobacter mediterraneus]
MKNFLFSVVAMSLLAKAAAASPGYMYDCDLQGTDKAYGWITPKMAFVVEEQGDVKVVDGVVLHFNNAPLETKVLRNDGKRMILRWVVTNAKADSGRTFNNFRYRASLSKSSGKVEVTAIPAHYDTGVRATGVCKKRTK